MEKNISMKAQLPKLEELGFAPADYPWDEEAAFTRLLEAFGWAGIDEYSLWSETTGEVESEETYQMLLADIVDGEPRIVPRALDAAEETLTGAEEAVREQVESDLALLRERFRRIAMVEEEKLKAEVTGESVISEDAEVVSDSTDVVTDEVEDAARLKEAAAFVDKLTDQGRFLNAWGRDALVHFIAGLSSKPDITTRDGEAISALEYFKRFLEKLPALVPLSELARPQAARDSSLESLGSAIAKCLTK